MENPWKYIESVESSSKGIAVEFPNYSAGSEGPMEAEELLLEDGRHWWNTDLINCPKEQL